MQTIVPWKSAMRTETDGSDSMDGAFSATAPLNPALQKVILEEQRLVRLPAQGDAAWKAPAENHSQRVY